MDKNKDRCVCFQCESNDVYVEYNGDEYCRQCFLYMIGSVDKPANIVRYNQKYLNQILKRQINKGEIDGKT